MQERYGEGLPQSAKLTAPSGMEPWPDVEAAKISQMTSDMLLTEDVCHMIMTAGDSFAVKRLEALCAAHAGKLKIRKEFNDLLKAYKVRLASLRNVDRGGKTNFIDQPIQLNCGDWICDVSGVRENKFIQGSGEIQVKYASPIPVLITEILENIDEDTEKIRIAYYKDGSWRSLICNRSTAASNTKIIELADRGLEVNSENAKLLVRYIADLIALNLDIIPRSKAVSKMGWFENEFMPYTGLKFDGENEFRHLYETIREKGDYDKWLEYTHNLRKNIYVRLQMGTSFASPLLSKIGVLPFILHLWGGSGSGKTVGMMTAMSVWGDPGLGKLVKTLNNTHNAITSISSFLNNIPFAGDELQSVKSYMGYDALIMKLCEGIGRGRMQYNKLEQSKTWNCAFLFTGEENCVRENSGGGAINRVISLECCDKVVEDGNSVVNFLSENHGFAGKKYIECIKNEPLHDEYTRIFRELTASCDATEKQCMAMACILLGDKMACKYIYTNEKPLTVEDVKDFLVKKSDVDVSERAYEFVLNLTAINERRFDGDASGEIWGKIDDSFILINKNILVREMRENGFEFDAVKSKWAEKGYLVKNSTGRLRHQTKCHGVKASYIKLIMRKEYVKEEIPF